jgi:hypothetical protein
MSIGRSGKESDQAKLSTRIHASCKTHCCQAPNMERKEEVMVRKVTRNDLIDALSFAIQEVYRWNDENLNDKLKNSQLKFRKYRPLENWDEVLGEIDLENETEYRSIDVIIEV